MPVEGKMPHGTLTGQSIKDTDMQTIIATFDEITRRAAGAERVEIDDLYKFYASMKAATETAATVGVLLGDELTSVEQAMKRTVDAIDAAWNTLARRQQALIDAVGRPELNLRIMPSVVTLLGGIRSADDTVIHLCRNHGEGFEGVLNGKRLGSVSAYDIETDRTTLSVRDIWSCAIDEIEAVGDEDGMFLLLRDGTLFEVRKEV